MWLGPPTHTFTVTYTMSYLSVRVYTYTQGKVCECVCITTTSNHIQCVIKTYHLEWLSLLTSHSVVGVWQVRERERLAWEEIPDIVTWISIASLNSNSNKKLMMKVLFVDNLITRSLSCIDNLVTRNLSCKIGFLWLSCLQREPSSFYEHRSNWDFSTFIYW